MAPWMDHAALNSSMAPDSSVAPNLGEDHEVGDENHRHHESWNDEYRKSSQPDQGVGIAAQEQESLSHYEDHKYVGQSERIPDQHCAGSERRQQWDTHHREDSCNANYNISDPRFDRELGGQISRCFH